MPKKKGKKQGFQLYGQVPLEDFDKIKAPRGKFIIVEKSENNITGWGYTKISTHHTKRGSSLAVSKRAKELANQANSCRSITLGRAIMSQVILSIDSNGNVLKEL